MSNMKTVSIKYDPKFFDVVKSIQKVTKKIVIKQDNDRVVIVQQSEGADININLSAPKSVFEYDKPVALADFANFKSVYDAVGDKSKIDIIETDPGEDSGIEAEPVSMAMANDFGTKIEYVLSNINSIKTGRTQLPQCGEEYSTVLNISADEVKSIKTLTAALVVQSAVNGTKLHISKAVGSGTVDLTFKGVAAVGNSFTKTYDSANAELELDLNFDPFFFDYVPSGLDVQFKIANAEKENSNAVDFIIGTSIVKDEDDDSEIATLNFIAGKLSV